MSYLDKYKVGSTLFRTLSEGRMQFNVLRNAVRYSHPAPTGMVNVQDIRGSSSYEKRSDAMAFSFPKTTIEPERARSLLDRNTPAEFPESFILGIPGGRVLGDGTVVTKDNCIVSETTIDFHRKQEYHHLLSEKKVPAPERFDGRLAVITSPGNDNYFHWTLDSVPRFSLLQGMDNEIDAYYVDNRNAFHREWLGMLDIPKEKVFPSTPERHIQAAELVVPSFAGLPGLPSPKGLEFVRKFMPTETDGDGKRIYISRSDARRRRIHNEIELLPILEKHGFEIVHPGKMTVQEQMQKFASASVVVSPHGAELTNLAFCQAGTLIIEILSPYYLNPCFRELSAAVGLQHTAFIGRGGTRVLRKQMDTHFVWANIRVQVDEFCEQLERLLG